MDGKKLYWEAWGKIETFGRKDERKYTHTVEKVKTTRAREEKYEGGNEV